jgi:hypothetical protein
MNDSNTKPELAPIPPRLRLLQAFMAVMVFSVVPLLPADAHAPTQADAVAGLTAAKIGL